MQSQPLSAEHLERIAQRTHSLRRVSSMNLVCLALGEIIEALGNIPQVRSIPLQTVLYERASEDEDVEDGVEEYRKLLTKLKKSKW